jgi:hypothetical protein
VSVDLDKRAQWVREVNASSIDVVWHAGERVCRGRSDDRDQMDGRGKVLPTALFRAFQKSTVFEKVTKHRETVAEVNVSERMNRMLLGYGRVSKGEEQDNALQAEALKQAG